MFHEYPKGLFRDGDALGECRIVLDKAQEEAVRAGGFRSIGESKEKLATEQPKRRGRPPKAVE